MPGQAWSGIGFSTIVPVQLLHTFFNGLSNQVLHFLCCRPWPCRNDRELLHSERGILSPSQLEEGDNAGNGDKQDQE